MSTYALPRGYPAGVKLSLAKIESVAKRARAILAPEIRHLAALPGVRLFERLRRFKVKVGDRLIGLEYHVADLPFGREALAIYDQARDVIVVVLSPRTYENLENDVPRARFSLAHEIGHAILHAKLLVQMGCAPHHEAALMRGEVPQHKHFEDTEWQADAFAAAILMPVEGILAIEARDGTLSAWSIQDTFLVSAESAHIRLRNFHAAPGRSDRQREGGEGHLTSANRPDAPARVRANDNQVHVHFVAGVPGRRWNQAASLSKKSLFPERDECQRGPRPWSEPC